MGSYPDRRYKVLAEMDAPTTRLALAIGARRVKDVGGNAMIVLVEGDAAGSMTVGTGPTGRGHGPWNSCQCSLASQTGEVFRDSVEMS